MAKKASIRVSKRSAKVKAPTPRPKKVEAKKPDKPPAPKIEALEWDAFSDSYFDTAIWAEKPEDCDADVWPGCYPKILQDCDRFQRENEELLNEAYQTMTRDGYGHIRLYDVTDAGHDFFLSRNGHGTGFWDRGLGEVGDKLHEAASAFGGVDVLPGEGEQEDWLFIE